MYRAMATFLFCTTALTSLTADWPANCSSRPVPHAEIGPEFDGEGELRLPKDFRRWVFIGSTLTPNALNGGAAAFPEFHNVYVEPAVFDYYLSLGTWPEGTVLVRELQLSKPGASEDGSREEASGRGYFPGPANGLDVSVKDTLRFPDTNGWGFFTFGHHAPPYQQTAAEASIASCAGCHMTSAHEDMVFSDFYEQLRPGAGNRKSPAAPAKASGEGMKTLVRNAVSATPSPRPARQHAAYYWPWPQAMASFLIRDSGPPYCRRIASLSQLP